jgi:predicted phosphodiesterase
MATIEAFAPLVDRVYFDVVGGNHDDADRQLNSWPGNNWATETASVIADALTLNPASFSHVTIRVPDKWRGHMTVAVGEDNPTVVTVIHGHQWRRGRGMDWWAGQAHNRQPAGASQILQCGHYHEWAVESTRDKTLIQSPTFDCGSDWYREKTGAESRRGGLAYLLNAGEVTRMSVV